MTAGDGVFACYVGEGDTLHVLVNHLGGAEIDLHGPGTDQGVFLTREETVRLRDHLTAILGDGVKGAPEKFLPDAVWNAARTPTAIELATTVRAEAETARRERFVITTGPVHSVALAIVSEALSGLADRLEAMDR